MRKAIVYLLIFLLLLAAPTALRYLKFYQLGGPERADPPPFNPENITQVPTPPATEHVDEPEVGEGLVLLDQAHKNNFELAEIAHLDGRLAARGFELQPYEGGDLGTALRAANALVVISPLESYVDEEIRAVVDFVRRGGRLLLIGDPTRFNVAFDEEDEFNFEILLETDEIPLNSLANQFDLIFVGDYLYNTLENEGNFRNIILDEIGDEEDQLLEGLDRLVFYSSHSVQVGPEGESLIDADDNTWSSATDRPGGLALAAASHNRQVLAVGDVHFLMDPYYTVYDNGRFIANIADFLVRTSDRQYVLADFPYFFDDDVDLIYTGSPELGPDAFDEIIIMQDAFRGIAKNLELVAESRAGHDTLYLGLYNQSEQLVEVLASHGISLTIEPPVLTAAEIRALEDASEGGEEGEEDSAGADEEEQQTEANGPDDGETAEEDEVEIKQLIHSSLGSIQMSGTALIIFEDGGQEQNVVALAASKEGLEQAIGRLLDLVPADGDYALSDCLLQDNLAFCPTNVPDEEVEAELLTGGVPAPPEEPEEEGDDDSDEGDGEEDEGDDEDVIAEELDAAQQGVIQLGETVQGALEEDESHSWIFDGGPATIDIVLGSAELDTVLELY
jgi:hypothetical protein